VRKLNPHKKKRWDPVKGGGGLYWKVASATLNPTEARPIAGNIAEEKEIREERRHLGMLKKKDQGGGAKKKNKLKNATWIEQSESKRMGSLQAR